jgi:hypothetical protein
MTMVGPPAVVDAPLLAPPASGLLHVARVLRDNAVNPHDEMGVRLLPEGCGAWSVHDPCGFTSAAPGDAPAIVYGPPFIIDAEDVCTSSSLDITQGRARRLLETVTHAAVERELWDGPVSTAHTAEGARFFADGSATVVSGTLAAPVAVSPRLGLALLEEFLGDTASGGLGMIHATRATATMLETFFATAPGAPVMTQTPLGTPFAPGSGYSGNGPNGAAPAAGRRWMFASDPVEVRLHAPDLTDRATSVDRDLNRVRTHARRSASISSSWCRLGAVLVDLTAA